MHYNGGSRDNVPHSALYVAGGSVLNCLIDNNRLCDMYRSGQTSQPEGIGICLVDGIVDRCVVTNNYDYQTFSQNAYKGGSGDGGTAGGVYLTGGIMRNSLVAWNKISHLSPVKWDQSYAGGVVVAGGTFINNTVIGNQLNEFDNSKTCTFGSLIVKDSGVVKNTLVKDNLNITMQSAEYEPAPIALTGGTLVNCSTAEKAYYFKNGVLKLTSNSPCRNAGANEDWMEYSTDLNGNTRLFGRRVDIGAVESQTAGFSVIVR
jgi:hypothetical protein